MAIGLCCHFLEGTDEKHKNVLSLNVLQLGRYRAGKYTPDVIRATYIKNLKTLREGLPHVFSIGYKSFRFPSGIFPLFDQVSPDLWDNDLTRSELRLIGDIVKSHSARATFHPGQFCSLSSQSASVIHNSVQEINHHAWIFDQMGLPATAYCAINVHGGGRGREDALVAVINGEHNGLKLSDSARARLTLENDETCYTVADLLTVHKLTGIPIVWDSHHHTLNPGGLDDFDAVGATMATWGDIKPLQHISNSEIGVEPTAPIQARRAHSKHIRYIPEAQLRCIQNNIVDIDVEAKLKNFAIDKLCQQFKLPLA